jgi:hypothetical protein
MALFTNIQISYLCFLAVHRNVFIKLPDFLKSGWITPMFEFMQNIKDIYAGISAASVNHLMSETMVLSFLLNGTRNWENIHYPHPKDGLVFLGWQFSSSFFSFSSIFS